VTNATPLFHNFSFYDLVSLTINLPAKFEVRTFSRSRDIRGSQNLKSRSRNIGHAPFWPFFHFWFSVLYGQSGCQIWSLYLRRSRDIRGSHNLKVSNVTQATPPCDLILSFWISISWFPVDFQISTWLELLFWRYCRYHILAFWLENAYSGQFLAVWGDFDPWNYDIVVLTPKECNCHRNTRFEI